jgi:hypothetical protein
LLDPGTGEDHEGGDAWSSLPELGDLQRLGELKPAATTLLEFVAGDEVHPLLVTQPYGLGTTAVLATASTWRWQMRTPPEDPRHSLFWRQLLRQLAETAQQRQSVNVSLDGEGVVIRARLLDEQFEAADNVTATATVTAADRSIRHFTLTPGVGGVSPGMLAARYVPGDAGVYRVDVTLEAPGMEPETVTRFVRAGSENREFFNPVRNDALLRRIAETTGGRFLQPAEVGELADVLTFASTGIRTVEILPLWQSPLFFFVLVLLKLTEWGLRRVFGRI